VETQLRVPFSSLSQWPLIFEESRETAGVFEEDPFPAELAGLDGVTVLGFISGKRHSLPSSSNLNQETRVNVGASLSAGCID